MANSTGFITNNVDLNTVFAPINNIDYGIFNVFSTSGTTNPNPIGETWSIFNEIDQDGGSAFNVTSDSNGFTINKIGIYKLSISLRFTSPFTDTDQQMVFILNSGNIVPANAGYVFTPYPSLASIYSFGGLSVAGTGTLTNNNNTLSLANSLQTNASGDVYMFSFRLKSANTNIATFEITFLVTTVNAKIYPQIRCTAGGPSTSITFWRGRWLFEKLSY